ncbi:Sua5/YciO/YrdC/YwlC family protein [Pseudoxanthomonas suwonensis]|uniref:Sua5/YciO/YrdC/YwlC family protein n=1 Tax=Pseudoxanthomonas suwonensis TaxID=314722 RepID=UPI00138ED297|nr:Sua5/YciO/YrdC/YwlC family protein [Pseudoxanthomonas suwonensis]KAF1698623.1 tRNA threonylcarbamoyladenosine biosynthesis protein RimN [Pseudoxanthomonas suwonensis]
MDNTLDIAAAIDLVRRGGVIAYPTEAVWGLGCDPANEAAVLRLLEIKQRPVEKGLIVVAAGLGAVRPWLARAQLPAGRMTEVCASWPGPNPWAIPATPLAPPWVTGSHRSLAVRVSAHPVVVALCEALGGPLVSTSANLAGQPPAYSRGELDPALLAGIDGVVGGQTAGLDRPTPIRAALDGSVLRG